MLGCVAGPLSGPEQNWYLWEENSKYPFPDRPLLISFFPVLTITSTQLWQTLRQEGPQVWPHYLFLLPDDIRQLHLVNQSLLGDGEERREDTCCPYQSSLPSLSVCLGLEITRSPFGQGTTQKYILALLTFLSKSVFILRQHFSNSKVYKTSTWGSRQSTRSGLVAPRLEPKILSNKLLILQGCKGSGLVF